MHANAEKIFSLLSSNLEFNLGVKRKSKHGVSFEVCLFLQSYAVHGFDPLERSALVVATHTTSSKAGCIHTVPLHSTAFHFPCFVIFSLFGRKDG